MPASIPSIPRSREFRVAFEQACEALQIPLYVLPPRRPQYNGCVERANDTTRVEFWNLYDGAFTVEAANRAWPTTSTSTTRSDPTRPSTG